MGRKRKQRRRPHGSAWHWKQTDSWYCTRPGIRKRIPLFDEEGQRIRGKGNREAAELALARERLSWDEDPHGRPSGGGEWLVARACSDYLQYCERGVAASSISKSHRDNASSWLNDLCKYCGALPVARLKKGHIQKWLEGHVTWKSSATRRGVLSIVLAAFNRVEEMYGVANPLKGLKKPRSQPRLQSFSEEDEKAIYQATEDHFRDFLFAAIHTGLRPFCELARLTADDVEVSDRGTMWRVCSSKTKKTRKIPVRPEVAELTRKLMKTAPQGSGIPLFRNTRGMAWKPGTGVVRFIAIKKKLGWDKDPVKSKYSCYTCRHTFVHRMLSGYWTNGNGCSIETLAELIGDTPKVAFDHYGREWGQHYQDPLWAAIGEERLQHHRRKPREREPRRPEPHVPDLGRPLRNRNATRRNRKTGEAEKVDDRPLLTAADVFVHATNPRGVHGFKRQFGTSATRFGLALAADGLLVFHAAWDETASPLGRRGRQANPWQGQPPGRWRPSPETAREDEWLVAKVCSLYIEYCRQGVAAGTLSNDHADGVALRLNQLCEYCGSLPVSQLSKGHIEHWVGTRPTWRSPVTRHGAIAIVLAAFNYALNMHDVPHRLKGVKKPPSRPRLHSSSEEDEASLYEATDEFFGNFLFAAIQTGLRPFCELARLTADDVAETDRGMMWRVYSSKTKKTRKIPIRTKVAELTRQLIETASRGSGLPVYRNTLGKPWKKVTGVGRFLQIKRKLGWDKDRVKSEYSCCTCRHTFAQRMLAGFWNGGVGCSIETLAELMGDTPKVAFDHYGREWGQHYQEPLWAAIGIGERSTAH